VSWYTLLDEQDLADHEAAADPHVVYQLDVEKGQPNGYAALNASGRVSHGLFAPDDVIVDDANRGLVLKDGGGQYWRVTVDSGGLLVTTNLGPVPP
jgi:hypothetical protein